MAKEITNSRGVVCLSEQYVNNSTPMLWKYMNGLSFIMQNIIILGAQSVLLEIIVPEQLKIQGSLQKKDKILLNVSTKKAMG
ncbi:10616_t:CDS:2 [Acaulospora morrowiae]|uniref:10616_t:CDS:1 n=1 Tax=Acaulospora morrowiae TaxID=94023 RepID=A0A9N8VTV2_9GLOM|nr:10616_t:CDS:2 [Acaulospora morrowiae]